MNVVENVLCFYALTHVCTGGFSSTYRGKGATHSSAGKHDSKSQALVMAKQKIKPLGLLGTHFKKPLKYMDDEKEIVISAKTVEVWA